MNVKSRIKLLVTLFVSFLLPATVRTFYIAESGWVYNFLTFAVQTILGSFSTAFLAELFPLAVPLQPGILSCKLAVRQLFNKKDIFALS